MIGNPMTAVQWSRALRADVGDEVLRILMPFHERPIELRPCADTAALAAAALGVLEGLGIPDGNAKVISRNAFVEPGRSLELDRFIDAGLQLGLRNAVNKLLNDLFRPALGDEFRHNDGLGLLQDAIYQAQLLELHRRMTPLANVVSHNFFSCIYHQIGFLAMARKDLAAKVAPLTAMMADGHLPLGLTEDKTLIVLTA